MAEQMVLRIVLEGVDNASDDIDSAEGSANRLKHTIDDTTLSAAGLLLAVNGLASGFNQMSGGMRKFADAGEKTGRVSEENAKKIRAWSDSLEYVSGPLEVISGLANTFASLVIAAKFVPELLKGTRVAALFGSILAGAGVVIGSTAFIIGALIAAILFFTYSLYVNREAVVSVTQKYVDLGGRVEWVARKFDDARDAAEGFSDAVRGAFDIPGNIRNQINSELRGGV